MTQISVFAELERAGLAWESASDTEVKVRCPFHKDTTPSCSVNTESALFHCHAAGCNASGDIYTLLAKVYNSSRAMVYIEVTQRYGIDDVKVIEPSVIEDAYAELPKNPQFVKELYARGVTDEEIRRYRIGFRNGRITIPVKNDGGSYVNIRHYLPGAKGTPKFKNSRGRGQIRPFPIEQFSFQSIVVCGGELKAIVSATALNQHGYGCICASGGEGNWHHSITARLVGKNVYVMLDVDEAGVAATKKLATILSAVAKSVKIVKLPLDKDKYPKGDVNDFIGKERGDLLSVILAAEDYITEITVPSQDEPPVEVSFSNIVESDNVGRRVRFNAVVAATAEQPYVVPATLKTQCGRNQDLCAACGIFALSDDTHTIAPESPALLQMVGVGKDRIDTAVREALSIPKRCPDVTIRVLSHYDVEDIRVAPSLEITNKSTDRPMQHAYCINTRPTLNGSYSFTARMWPHPQTQHATMIVSQADASVDALDSCSVGDVNRLKVFQPDEWRDEGLDIKLENVYSDLSANVTRIYLRSTLHLFVDLAFHSVLLFEFEGKLTKGWTEILVVGDSSQGKTEVADGLMRHYGVGEKAVCKNASLAGLMGGLKQIGTQWYVSWGVIPTHDKRLVVLEELKGASIDVIARLTDMRSSGIAEIPKIEKRRTHARTRLLALSNPRNDRVMSSFSFGVEAIKDLIGAPEDIRRFDAALIVAAGEVNITELTTTIKSPPQVTHVYNASLCNQLVIWGWTRKHQEVIFEPEAVEEIFKATEDLCSKFTESVPLIDRGSMRLKLARLSAALAVRTFSTDDGSVLKIRGCHVRYIHRLLKRVYESPVFGYKYYTDAYTVTRVLRDPEVLTNRLQALAYPDETVAAMLYADGFDIVDLTDWTGFDRTQAQDLLSLLVRKQAVRRVGGKYFKTPEFIAFLKALPAESKQSRPQEKF